MSGAAQARPTGIANPPTPRASPRRPSNGTVVRRVAITLLVIVEVLPLLWLFLSSLKQESEFSLNPVYALPQGIHLQNYVEAWTTGNVGTYFLNSLLVVVPSVILVVTLCATGAFALEILRWPGRDRVLLLFVAGILVPGQMVLLPLFTIYFQLGLLNSRLALILTYVAFGLPLGVFLMVGYYKAVPREVLEAAVMDGATVYQAFRRVVLPMVANAVATVALVSFLFIWGDLLLALTFVSDSDQRTIQTGLLAFADQYGARRWGPTFAAISIATLPTLLVFVLLNQRVIRGLTAGAVKG